jgi:hypothetical protein
LLQLFPVAPGFAHHHPDPVLSKNSSEAEEEWNCDVRLPINKLIRPEFSPLQTEGSIRRRKRLGELLSYYYREAA